MLKVVFLYNLGAKGWTETWYNDSAATPSSFINGLPDSLFAAAIGFRAHGATLYGIRASGPGPSGNLSYFLPLGGKYHVTDEAIGLTQTESFVAALYKVISITGQSKHIWLRGLRAIDTNFDIDGFPVLSANARQQIATYLNACLNASLGIRYYSKPIPPVTNFWNVIQVAPGANPQSDTDVFIDRQYTPTPAGNFAVRFQGVPTDDLPGFPKQCNINFASTQVPWKINIPYRYRASTGTETPQRMRLFYLAYNVVLPNQARFETLADHKTGRPFGVARGRVKPPVTRR